MSSSINIVRKVLHFKGFIRDSWPSGGKLSLLSSCRHLHTRFEDHSSRSRPALPPPGTSREKISAVPWPLMSVHNVIPLGTPIQRQRPILPVLDRPVTDLVNQIVDLPVRDNPRVDNPSVNQENIIEDPQSIKREEKQAVRMIIIRKRKMRIHKLKKLRKKMRFVTAKIKLKRRQLKEKDFRTKIHAMMKEAVAFDPALYARDKIAEAAKVKPRRYWKGKKLPEFIVRDLFALKEKKRQARHDKAMRRKNMNINAADHK